MFQACPQMGWKAGFIGFGSVGIAWALLWLLFLSRCRSTGQKLPEYTYVPPKVLSLRLTQVIPSKLISK